jgi:SagB-type dehydrogenase family enzyme
VASTRRRFLVLLGQVVVLVGGAGMARAQERARAIHRTTRNTLRGAIGRRLRRLLPIGRPPATKPYPGRERIALSNPGQSRRGASLAQTLARYASTRGFVGEPIPRGIFDRVLHFTNGVTGHAPSGKPLRAAPSAGALYAGEVYVVVERVEGIEPGVYAYAPLEESMVRLRHGSHLAEVAAALEDPGRAHGAAVAFLLTNVFARYRWRYANRGYRYALIDSGHIGENLRLVATANGLEWGPLRFHDDRLHALLGVDGIEEAVCAVHLLGRRAGRADARLSALALIEAGRAGRPLPEAADDAPERYHEATKLVTRPGADPPRAVREADTSRAGEATLAGGGDDARGPELPRRVPRTRVEETIAVRRSARRFDGAPLDLAKLGFVLDAAGGHGPLRRVAGIELRLFAHRVADAPAGLYRVEPGARLLTSLRKGDLAGELVDACLGQEKAREAAAGIAMVAAIEEVAARSGDRAYRDLCLEAGAIAQRVYLAAEALGLAARNLGAFLDDRLNELADVDRDRRVLHLTLLGPGD